MGRFKNGLYSAKVHGVNFRITDQVSHAREDMDFEGVEAMFKTMARVGRFKVQCSMPYHSVDNASWRIGWSSLYGNIKKIIQINMR